MLVLVDLADNSEHPITPTDLKTRQLNNAWLQLTNPTQEELSAVAEKTDIPADLLELPKTSTFINLRIEPEYVIINFTIVKQILTQKEIHPIIIAITKNNLITIQKDPDPHIINMTKQRMNKTKIDPPALVAYYILDEIVADHFDHLEQIEENTATLEEQVLEKPDHATMKGIFRLKSRLVSFNKILWYQRGAIFNLRKCETTCLTAKTRNLFDTTHEYLTRQIDIVETYREILSDAINAYLSTVSNRINRSIRSLTLVMFYLTVITLITSFPNTVATFFGISQFGTTHYAVIFTALILSIILPAVWLWKKKWLKFD